MNILVTGGAGFIGSHIADEYISAGHNVVIIDNLLTGKKEFINSRTKFYETDIRDNSVGDILRENKIEVINHHAAQINLRLSVSNPLNDLNINVLGSVNLFEHAVKNKVRKIIFASSGGAIYSNEEMLPSKEGDEENPCSPYGINKLVVEKYLNYYKKVHSLDYTALRYANAYGPRQNSGGGSGVIAIFAAKLLKGEEILINGTGEQSRDYVFVKDIVNANTLALGKTNFDIYNVGTEKETTVNYIFDKLSEYASSEIKAKHGPAKAGEQMRSSLNYGRINEELGWAPKTGIDEGLKLTLEFFKERV